MPETGRSLGRARDHPARTVSRPKVLVVWLLTDNAGKPSQ
jgi:hypothetical protein